MFKNKITAKYKVTARSKFKHIKNDDLREFISLVNSYDDWYFETRDQVIEELKDEHDDWESMDETEREDLISEAIKNYEEMESNSKIFFSDLQILPKGTWLIHFTKDDPRTFINDLSGNAPENLGLTTHFGGGIGDLYFGFQLNRVNPLKRSSYGDNAILVQVDEAVEVEHVSDVDRHQSVFATTSIKKSFSIIKQNKTYKVFDNKGQHLFEEKIDTKVFDRIIKKVK